MRKIAAGNLQIKGNLPKKALRRRKVYRLRILFAAGRCYNEKESGFVDVRLWRADKNC